MTCVQRYNLFSGGGCLPPMWGLGVWYRGYGPFNQEESLSLAEQLRRDRIPCDVWGVEPGWQSRAYSCSYSWSKERFPEPDKFLKRLEETGYRCNLWEHIFVHPESPIHTPLKKVSGDHLVWKGLVPDFTVESARRIFADYHDEKLISKGVSGFKCDECDNSDYIRYPWSFPEYSEFPSGMDGEQMHSLLGLQYQRTLCTPFRKHNRRTYQQVRSSHALASPYPYVLYSDLYEHGEFVRGILSASFSGLLWTPEVRQTNSVEDLVRRLQTTVFSPMAHINCWMIPNPPWKQFDRDKNKAGEFLDNADEVTELCRSVLQMRMRFLPMIYTLFADYKNTGIPPFRSSVLDFPQDERFYSIDDQYMMGPDILVAPLFEGQTEREITLPEGDWHDVYSGEMYTGSTSIRYKCPLERIPLFVRTNTLIPLAEPVEHVTSETRFRMTVLAFGDTPRDCRLYSDDGETFDFENGQHCTLTLSWNSGEGSVSASGDETVNRYEIIKWKKRG